MESNGSVVAAASVGAGATDSPVPTPSPASSIRLTAFAAVAVAAFVGVRSIITHGLSGFPVAAPPATASGTRGLRGYSDGYDGQFVYRLALDPFTHAVTAHGITLDNPAYRQQRIATALLAHVARGHPRGQHGARDRAGQQCGGRRRGRRGPVPDRRHRPSDGVRPRAGDAGLPADLARPRPDRAAGLGRCARRAAHGPPAALVLVRARADRRRARPRDFADHRRRPRPRAARRSRFAAGRSSGDGPGWRCRSRSSWAGRSGSRTTGAPGCRCCSDRTTTRARR